MPKQKGRAVQGILLSAEKKKRSCKTIFACVLFGILRIIIWDDRFRRKHKCMQKHRFSWKPNPKRAKGLEFVKQKGELQEGLYGLFGKNCNWLKPTVTYI